MEINLKQFLQENPEKAIVILKSSNSTRNFILTLGYRDSAYNYKVAKAFYEAKNISTAHFVAISSSRRAIEFYLVENSNHKVPKKRLISEGILKEECSECKMLPIWNGKYINLHLDHINGISNDNRLENLRILCPNCHSQQPTSNRKKTKKNFEKILYFCVCKKEINKNSKLCRQCENLSRKERGVGNIINWPSDEFLLEKLKHQSFLSLGKFLGVSDNAIRKRLRSHGHDLSHIRS